MKCSDIHNLLLDYIDNNLVNKEKAEFESHLKDCDKCSREVLQFKELNQKLANTSPIESPENFKTEFYSHFKKEKNILNKSLLHFSLRPLLKAAAAILFFVSGTVFGLIIQKQMGANSKLTLLEQEVNQLKQQVHLTALIEKTPSEKILAIEYLNSFEVNPELLNTYSSLLNNDENTNVRLEAAEALYKLRSSKEARNILLKALSTDQKPIVQIKLINYLVDIEETRIIDPLKNIIKDNNTNKMVKDFAQSSLQTII